MRTGLRDEITVTTTLAVLTLESVASGNTLVCTVFDDLSETVFNVRPPRLTRTVPHVRQVVATSE